MENSINSELERVRFEKIRHVSVFINSIMFRNMHEHGALELAIWTLANLPYLVLFGGIGFAVAVIVRKFRHRKPKA